MECTPSYWLELSKLVIPSIIIACGWAVVHKLSISRDQDKARREMVSASADALCSLIDIIHKEALLYHSQVRDKAKEAKIKMHLQDFNYRVTSLNKIAYESLCKPTWELVIPFRRAITGKHFEDEHTSTLDEGNIQLEWIAEATLGIKRALIELKHAQFPLQSKNNNDVQ